MGSTAPYFYDEVLNSVCLLYAEGIELGFLFFRDRI
jgi:hypothetical protein